MKRRTLLTLSLALLCAMWSTAATDSIAVREALVKISVASLRARPGHAAELETQALMGTPLRLDRRDGEWYHAVMPNGYKAWINKSSVAIKSGAEMTAWRESERVIISSLTPAYLTSDTVAPNPRNIVTDLVFGDIIETTGRRVGDKMELVTPDGRRGWVADDAATPLPQWSAGDPDPTLIMDYAEMMTGTPYLWGGNSSKAADCSGLTSVCYMMAGIMLPRNASQQALIGDEVDKTDRSKFAVGDLIFFTNAKGRVNHVGMKYYGDKIIHASGSVKINSLNPSDPDYINRPIHSVRRVIGSTPADGGWLPFSRVKAYFNR